MSIRKWSAHVKAIFGEIDHQHRKDTDNASMLLSKISSVKQKISIYAFQFQSFTIINSIDIWIIPAAFGEGMVAITYRYFTVMSTYLLG